MSTKQKPKRVQRKRTKGAKLPPNTIYVGRPTKWGNPFVVEQRGDGQWIVRQFSSLVALFTYPSQHEAKAGAVRLYRAYLANDGSQPGAIRDSGGAFLKELAKTELRGYSLACWCGDGPCHADVLLEIANA